MAQLTYNVITQEVKWNCPNCRHINNFSAKERMTTVICGECKLHLPLDPLRYAQFEKMQERFEDNLIEILGGKIDGKEC